MGRCVLWADVSYGPMCLMGRCVLWAGVSYGLGNMVGNSESVEGHETLHTAGGSADC